MQVFYRRTELVSQSKAHEAIQNREPWPHTSILWDRSYALPPPLVSLISYTANKLWVVCPIMVVDKGDALRSSRYAALFLISSLDFKLTEKDYYRYLKVAESRLVPLLENGILGHDVPGFCGVVVVVFGVIEIQSHHAAGQY